jgi:nucleotide-binding universal stress UspA family protein
MKTIFIATDFSSAAHNASKYGIELASKFGARIVLFHAYIIPLSIPESYVIVNAEDVKKTAESYLLEEVKVLRKSTVQAIDILAAEGSAPEIILLNASKYSDCMIVMGMKGEGLALRKLIGNTTTAVARKTHLPLIIIPESAEFNQVKKVAFASDIDYTISLKTIDMLKEIGLHFNSQIFIVKVLKNSINEIEELTYRSERLKGKLNPLQVDFAFPRGAAVADVLQDFITENKIELIAMVPHHHNLFERLFVKSETRKFIFHSHIPLLILPEITIEKYEPENKLLHQKA